MTRWQFFELNSDEIAELTGTVSGVGGFEDFIRQLQRQFNPATSTIKLTEDDLAEIPHIAFDYKGGGFENRLRRIFGRVLGPKLGRED